MLEMPIYPEPFCFWYAYSASDTFEDIPSTVKMKDNILLLDLPGYEKEDVDVEFDDSLITVKTNDKMYLKKYKVNRSLEVDNASMKAGQLKIVFKEKAGTKIKIN